MTYKVRTTVQEPSRLVLDDLPFLPGQRVEVVVISEEDARLPPADALRDLLAKTQGLSTSATIPDEEISAEIAAHRAGGP